MTLCVTIARSAVSRQKAEHAALAKAGAKLVELRLDWIKGEVDVARLLADRPTPVVVTCRRREDGGRWMGSEDDRLKLLRAAILEGPEFVDLERDAAGKIPRFGKTKRVVSHHDMKATPGSLELAELHGKLAAADADVVKLVTLAEGVEDNAALIAVQKKAKLPTIAFCMGEWGLPSRVACCRFGAPWTYCAFTADREIAPGLPSHKQMRAVYRAHRVGKSTRLFGVLGDPVEHSLSPHLHNAAFRAAKVDGCYLPVRVPAERFAEGVAALRDCGFGGFSVTIPHKQAALDFADKPDDAAKRIGAANTLWLDRSDEKPAWRAANTDRDAALASIDAAVKADDDEATAHRPPSDGAGVRRRRPRGRRGSHRGRLRRHRHRPDREEGARAGHGVRRHRGDVAEPPHASGRHRRELHAGGDVAEDGRVPAARKRDPAAVRRIRHDLQPPPHPAAEAREGPRLPRRQRRRDVRPPGGGAVHAVHRAAGAEGRHAGGVRCGDGGGEVTAPRGVISLVGPRGSGKSTVGRLLAAALGVTFADSDEEIETRDGRPIPAIFAADGEAGFRAIEAEAVVSLLDRGPLVLATGGGVILNPETRRRLREAGEVVYLHADAATLHARTAGDPNRPALTDLPAQEEVAAVLAVRGPLYRQAATITVPATGSPEDVRDRILAQLAAGDDD